MCACTHNPQTDKNEGGKQAMISTTAAKPLFTRHGQKAAPILCFENYLPHREK